jgi:uncharacterized coiled-coil DUF342 family protein
LEAELTKGSLKLIEEKRVVAEISNLKKARKILETLGSDANTVKNDKEELDRLHAELDTLAPRKDEINKQYDVVKAELKGVEDEKKKDLGSFNELIGKKKELKAQIDTQYNEMRSLRDEFRKSNDEWFHWERAEKERKQNEYREQKKKADSERLARAAQRELEDADIPAFTEEINNCNALIKFLQQYTGQTTSSSTTSGSANAATNARKVDSSLPDGAVALTKKSDREEEFFFGGKSKKGKRPATAASSTPTQTTKTLKIDFVTMDIFFKLKVDVPLTVADAEPAIKAIEEKKAKFLADQKAQTEANKAKALAKIAAIKAKAEAGGSVDDAIAALGGESAEGSTESLNA